jgi:HEAT repeat protein
MGDSTRHLGKVEVRTNKGVGMVYFLVTLIDGAKDVSVQGKSHDELTTVYTTDGAPLTISPMHRQGGEGAIHFIVGNPTSCAKIYHRDRLSSDIAEKIGVMIANPPDDRNVPPSIAWPRAVLYHDAAQQQFAGYMMALVDTSRYREAHRYFDPADRTRICGEEFTWRHLLATAVNLVMVVHAVHAKGHSIGDLRETNILISPSAKVCIIDCDSFQVKDPGTGRIFPTRVGSPEYLPPEFLPGLTFRSPLRDEAAQRNADLFALAVLVFRLLMDGTHPFQARGPLVRNAPATPDKIRLGHFPYREGLKGVTPPEFAPPYQRVPEPLQQLFFRAFVPGHRNPSIRPKAQEWYTALLYEFSRLTQCQINSRHYYRDSLPGCPWCAPTLSPSSAPAVGGAGHPVSSRGPLPIRPQVKIPPSPVRLPTSSHKVPPPSPPLPIPVMTPPQEVIGLINGLGDPVTARREALVQQLTALGVASVWPLADFVCRAQQPARGAALSALSRIGEPAVQPLIHALSKAPATSQDEIIDALAEMERPAIESLIREINSQRDKYYGYAARLVRRIGEPTIAPLIDEFRSGDARSRGFVAWLLSELGEAAVEPLINILRQDPNQLRGYAAWTIKKIGDPALANLITLLAHEDSEVRAVAAQTLIWIGDTAVPHLVAKVKEDPACAPGIVGTTLAKIGEPSFQPLLELTRSDDPRIRSAGAVILTMVGGPALDIAVVTCIAILSSDLPDEETSTAAGALQSIGSRAFPALTDLAVQGNHQARRRAWRLLLKGGEEGLHLLLDIVVQSGTHPERSLITLMSTRATEVAEYLVPTLLGEDKGRREAAFAILLQIPSEASPVLVRVAGSATPGQISIIGASLVKIGIDALPAVLEGIRVAQPGVVAALSCVLVLFGERAFPAVIFALGGEVPKEAIIPLLTTMILTSPPGPEVPQVIAPSISPERKVSLICMLATLADPALPLVAAYLTDPSHTVRQTARRALIARGAPAARLSCSMLKSQDPHARYEGVKTLVGLGDAATGELISSAIGDDAEVRKAAILLLQTGSAHIYQRILEQIREEGRPLRVKVELARLLVSLQGHDAAATLSLLASDNDPWVRAAVFPALVGMGSAGEDVLLSLLADDREEVREDATTVFVHLGPAAVPALTRGMRHRNKAVRGQAASLLAGAGWRAGTLQELFSFWSANRG